MTPYQYRLFSALRDLIRGNDGVAPTTQELGNAWNLASKSSVIRHLRAMESAGLIRRIPYRRQAMEIVRTCVVQRDEQGNDQIVGRPA